MGTEKVRGSDFSGECFLTKPNSTQVLAISARSEQYALFLTPIISTNSHKCLSDPKDYCSYLALLKVKHILCYYHDYQVSLSVRRSILGKAFSMP